MRDTKINLFYLEEQDGTGVAVGFPAMPQYPRQGVRIAEVGHQVYRSAEHELCLSGCGDELGPDGGALRHAGDTGYPVPGGHYRFRRMGWLPRECNGVFE